MLGANLGLRLYGELKVNNDQELLQSDPTSCPQNQKKNNKLTAVPKGSRSKPNEQLFPRQVVIQLPKIY